MIRIVTDSTCDLPQDIVERLGITVMINIGQEADLDGVEMSRETFYQKLPSSPFPFCRAGSRSP